MQLLCKGFGYIYDNHINVQGILCEILTNTFIPAFSGTHGITIITPRLTHSNYHSHYCPMKVPKSQSSNHSYCCPLEVLRTFSNYHSQYCPMEVPRTPSNHHSYFCSMEVPRAHSDYHSHYCHTEVPSYPLQIISTVNTHLIRGYRICNIAFRQNIGTFWCQFQTT